MVIDMKDANHDGSFNPYPDTSWERSQELGSQLNDAEAKIESQADRIEELEGALNRLSSPLAFTQSRVATAEETARMKFAEAALKGEGGE